MANYLGECHQELKPSELLQFFERSPSGCGLPPVMPNGGEIYLFCPGEDDTKKGIYAQMMYSKTSTLQNISSYEYKGYFVSFMVVMKSPCVRTFLTPLIA